MSDAAPPSPPNLLMILVDQLHWPQQADPEGMLAPIRDILTFQADPETNPFARYFPGFLKLAEHATVLADHTIAGSACIPSRAAMMTGQYGARTGVTQTDGLFKSGDAKAFPWLAPDGCPTMGDWLGAAGYSTHYFGKWHVSNPPDRSLRGYGFADWELSWPEPHGALLNDMGTFRDIQFEGLATTFLRSRGLGVPYARTVAAQAATDPEGPAPAGPAPFFAVCSFTNPHDIAAYPALPRSLAPCVLDPDTGAWVPIDNVIAGGAVPVPPQGSVSQHAEHGTMAVDLNPLGLPQDTATAPTTSREDLSDNKPRCQREYAIKLGLGLACKAGLKVGQQEGSMEAAVAATLAGAVPLALQDDPEAATAGFLQYYVFMISQVDRHILAVLDALEEAGLRETTDVVFASDHGEYGGSHGMMMEKWHGAYQEVVHVPVVVSSPRLWPDREAPVHLTEQTSHIDLLPTLLGLAGVDAEGREALRRVLAATHLAAPLPGADLSSLLVTGEGPVRHPDGSIREGVLFTTDDRITEPLPTDGDPHNAHGDAEYAVYAATVQALVDGTAPGHHLPWLTPGPVTQPNQIRALRSGPFKLVRTCDPWSADPAPDAWELYHLGTDPLEATNLVRVDQPFPTLVPTSDWPEGLDLTPEDLEATARALRRTLAEQEAAMLSPWPAPQPTADPSRAPGR